MGFNRAFPLSPRELMQRSTEPLFLGELFDVGRKPECAREECCKAESFLLSKATLDPYLSHTLEIFLKSKTSPWVGTLSGPGFLGISSGE